MRSPQKLQDKNVSNLAFIVLYQRSCCVAVLISGNRPADPARFSVRPSVCNLKTTKHINTTHSWRKCIIRRHCRAEIVFYWYKSHWLKCNKCSAETQTYISVECRAWTPTVQCRQVLPSRGNLSRTDCCQSSASLSTAHRQTDRQTDLLCHNYHRLWVCQ